MDELVEAQSKELSRAKRENPEKNDSLKLVLPGPQLNPVSAIVGSFIGQEAIKSNFSKRSSIKKIFLLIRLLKLKRLLLNCRLYLRIDSLSE